MHVEVEIIVPSMISNSQAADLEWNGKYFVFKLLPSLKEDGIVLTISSQHCNIKHCLNLLTISEDIMNKRHQIDFTKLASVTIMFDLVSPSYTLIMAANIIH